MKWFAEKNRKITKDNRGSTIIIVLVTMTFVVILGSVLLYASLVSLQMKRIDQGGKANFYNAEAVMNEIRAGVQTTVSDAIKSAYSEVLLSYNTTTKAEQITSFTNKYYSNLFASQIMTEDENTAPLFDQLGTSYNASVLVNLVSDQTGVVVDSASSRVEQLPDGTGIALKGITVSYAAKGYETTISTDIVLRTPVLPYTTTSMKQTAATDFALITKGLLQQSAGTRQIIGSVYAGEVAVSGLGSVLDVQNAANFIVDGLVRLSGGVMALNPNSALWASNIVLDIGGKLTVEGDAYLENDLNLLGNNTQALLSGRYFGFGASVTDPNLSSSIIVNGKDTVLDMSRLRALLLAGNSFVNYGTGTQGYVLMGESISVKSNQLAYLVPQDCLVGVSNPYDYTGSPSNEELAEKVLLDQKFLNDKTLADYGLTSKMDNIEYIRKNVGSTNLLYFCLKFTDVTAADGTVTTTASECANAYFKDYFNANSAQIQKYLDYYSDGILILNTTTSLAGGALTFQEGDNAADDASDTDDADAAIIDASGVSAVSVGVIEESYTNLCVTLSRTESGTEVSPYEYLINQSELAALTGSVSYPSTELAKVVVTNGDYTIGDTTPDTVRIVIASGRVEVSRDFEGLIIAGGDITLYRSVSASRAAVADALQALLTTDSSTGNKYYSYLNPEHISPLNTSTDISGVSSVWDMNALVTYANWTKN